jgi:hypothetical protein
MNSAARPAARVFSAASRIALGAMSQPVTANPVPAQTRASCPVPQPGTSTLPRANFGRAARKSTRPGEGAPFSHGMSPLW